MDVLHGGAMSAGLQQAAAAVDGYLDELSAGLLSSLSDADVLAELREHEALRRCCVVADHHLIAELERRGIAGQVCVPSTAALLQGVLRLSPADAKSRVRAAQLCGPRWALSGEQLPARLPRLLAAQARGEISVEHTRVILEVLHELPPAVTVEDRVLAEAELVTAAATLRPREVGLVGERIKAHLNPDGVLASDAEHERRRGFLLQPEIDGSYTARGRLTPSCGAQLLAALTPRSAPKPAEGGQDGLDGHNGAALADPRSYSQRMHDGLEELAGIAVRRSEPTESGAPAQAIITMTADQLNNRRRWVETSFGQLLSVGQALRMADEAAITIVGHASNGAVLTLGRTRRLASRAQTLALIARDKGCSFPGCDKPPEHTQRHHVIGWADGGSTDVDTPLVIKTSSVSCPQRRVSHG